MKRVFTFLDGQNIYHTVKELWPEYHWPNFCPLLLSQMIAGLLPERELRQVRIYTGIPDSKQNSHWHSFWTNKLRALKLKDPGIFIYKGKINMHGNEKGVDVRLAIDIIKLTFEAQFDVGIIFSQDRDLNEAILMARELASSQNRQIEFECAYPFSENMENKRGLIKSQWRRISREMYDRCLDLTDYRT